jgi:serine/threonine protein kinase
MADSPIRPGTVVDRFEVQEYLGRSPAGALYRGYDRSLTRPVTIVAMEGMTEPDSRERFASEAPKLAALHHPHAVEVVGFGERGQLPYVVYEQVRGGPLPEYLRGRSLERDEAVQVLGEIAGAVDEAHRSGVVHGDLEPSNVLVSPEGEAFVTGFGLTPLLPRAPQQSPVTPDADTAGFIAPEEASRGEVSPAADRYSFAGIAYEVLTGAPPFAGRTPADVLNSQLTTDPQSASIRNPALGPATDRVLRRGLAAQPDARWPTCTEMNQALAEAVRKDAAPVAVPTEQRRGRGGLIAIIAVLLVAALGIGLLLWARSHQAPTPGITLSDSSVQQGGSLIINGSQLPANQVGTVQLESTSQQIGAFQADQNGNTTVRVTIPENTTPGGHVVSLCWDTCHASAKLTVTERTPSPSPSPSQTPTPTPSPRPTLPPKPTPTTPPPAPPPTSTPQSAPSPSPT